VNRGTIFIYPAPQYIGVPVNRYSPNRHVVINKHIPQDSTLRLKFPYTEIKKNANKTSVEIA
jgi:hypothetical protein